MQRSNIEWTNFTANPLKYRDAEGNVVWGCIHASPGCQKCYAEALAKRYGRGGQFNTATMAGLTPFMDENELRHMLTYKPVSGKMCFVGDMTDLFGEWVPFELIDKLFAVFALRHDVTWQILTKRSERMREYLCSDSNQMSAMMAEDALLQQLTGVGTHGHAWPLPNVWMGVSVENQEYANKRIPSLLKTPAAIRFISYEPALGPVDFAEPNVDLDNGMTVNGFYFECGPLGCDKDRRPRINQIIVGGESGPGARPFHIRWVRDAVRQCRDAEVGCFVKQLGANVHCDDSCMDGIENPLTDDDFGGYRMHLKSSKGGDPEEWPEDLRVRQFPVSANSQAIK